MASDKAVILVVDDEEMVRAPLARNLASAGYEVHEAASADEALQLPSIADVDVLLTDIRMPGMDGIELLRRARAESPDLAVIVMTACDSVDTAVKAMKLGARDFVTKPFSRDEVLLRVERVLKEGALARDNRRLREALNGGCDVGGGARLIGTGSSMKPVLERIVAVSGSRCNVLVHGETGTGKELVASAIHCSGPRRDRPFVPLDCGSVTKTILESQLFGHVRGAFTGSVRESPGFLVAAEGGTLFLDEVTEVDTDTQVRLQRAIQERAVTPVGGTDPVAFDVRIVAATERDAGKAVEDGVLRRDLYHGLAAVVIDLPPLRERREDIPALVDYFNARLSAEYGMAPREVPGETMRLLVGHEWPGNVRQLENVVARAFAPGRSATIRPEDLPPEVSGGPGPSGSSHAATEGHESPSRACTLAEGERNVVLRALEEAGGNRSKAANILGIKRKRIYRLLHKHGLMRDSQRRH